MPAFVGWVRRIGTRSAAERSRASRAGTTRAHIVRAALESIALQVFDVVHAMEQDLRAEIARLCVDGGASANDFLMQFQADILGAEVVRPACAETTARGAAYLAGLYTGFYKDIDFLRGQAAEADVFFPQMERRARRKAARVGRGRSPGQCTGAREKEMRK